MRILKKLVICLWVICLVLPITLGTPAFAKGIKLSKKSITLYVGQTKTVRLKGTAKKPKWSSSKKSVATVTNNGKIKAKRKGNAVITAKLVGFLYAKGIVTLSTLTKTNTAITYTSTNAATTSEKNALYELGKTGLRVGLSYWNTLLEESGADLTLSDLGFTSYNGAS